MITVSSTKSLLLDNVPNAGARFGIYILGSVLGLALTFVLFEIIYLFVPHKKMKFKQTWCGAIIAASVLQLFMILFPLYVRTCMSSYTGRIGFAIILIFFIFFFSIILVIGAQINAFFFEHIQPLPDPLGTFICKQTDTSYGSSWNF